MQLVGFNYYFTAADGNDRVFSGPRKLAGGVAIQFKEWIEARYDAEVHTCDCIDWSSPQATSAIYFDYSWRYAAKDPFLARIPYEKRSLALIEPANINPSLYFIPFYRNRFKTIFTWDERLLRRSKSFIPINVPVGAEPSKYRDNPLQIDFSQKKFLIAVSRNCKSYMPQSTYRTRAKAYKFFADHLSDEFDLFGYGWSADTVSSYRGPIAGEWDDKVSAMANYKFAVCFENNASQPGYISEKILDCLCARCVPIYYGSLGIEKRIPKDCYIDFRDFNSFTKVLEFIKGLSAKDYSKYLSAIDRFMHSDALDFFSTDHLYSAIATGLGLQKRRN